MSEYQLTLTLDGAEVCDAQVRVWIDTELTGDLSCEQELDLARDADTSWSGLFSAPSGLFMYRVGICAAPGTAWSLCVRQAAADGGEVLFDSDKLTMAKEWLIGSCELGSAAAPNAAEGIGGGAL